MPILTKTMKAMVITNYGGTDVFCEKEMQIPEPKNKELLVKVHATSVNPVDYKIRKGQIPTGVKPPQILGFDVSGVVEKIGEKCTDFKIGDEVFYLPRIINRQGSYAKYHLVEEEIVAKKPKNLSHEEAASIPLVACTAWDALIERAKIKKGEKVLIHAGAGGVGSISIQLAKIYGCYVFTTCSTRNYNFLVEALRATPLQGSDMVIDYQKENFVDVVMEKTKGQGVDVVFDTVGGETVEKSIQCTKLFGRVASIVRVPSNLEQAFFKNIDIHPVFVQSGRNKLDKIRDLIERGQLKPVIDSVLPLRDVAKAHEKLEAGGVRGKIVLKVV